MEIFPAIDLKGGQVVRLTQGDYGRVEVYGDDPAAAARKFAREGARFLHVVDLDGAKDGALSNYEAVTAILRAADLFVEVGGGIRDEARVKAYLDAGAARVILGSAALKDPPFLRAMLDQYGPAIAVGVDARDGLVATGGWLDVSDVDAFGFCQTVYDMGARSVIYTDIARDGAMSGPNVEAVARLCAAVPGLAVTASGGVSRIEDLAALKRAGAAAAIVGKALYNGALTLPAVLAAAGEERA